MAKLVFESAGRLGMLGVYDSIQQALEKMNAHRDKNFSSKPFYTRLIFEPNRLESTSEPMMLFT